MPGGKLVSSMAFRREKALREINWNKLRSFGIENLIFGPDCEDKATPGLMCACQLQFHGD